MQQSGTYPWGSLLTFPITNLRAAIAEALGKSHQTPQSLVEEMEGLWTAVICELTKSIRDLTGLEHATHAY